MAPVFVDLHSADWTADDAYELAARRAPLENWECFYAGNAGPGRGHAIRAVNRHGPHRSPRSCIGRAAAGRELLAIPGETLTDTGDLRCGIVTFVTAGLAARRFMRGCAGSDQRFGVIRERARFDLLRRG